MQSMATPMPTANAPFTDRRPRPFLSASPFNPSLSFAFSPTPTFSLPHKTIVHMCASAGRSGPGPGPGSVGPLAADNNDIPMPIVHIDQDSHPYATIVQVSFGDRLGPLVDTMKALKDIGLDVSVGTISTENSVKEIELFITQLASGRKVEDPDLLERIRLTIINNLLKYHPESSELLALGCFWYKTTPEKVSRPGEHSRSEIDVDVATHIHVKDDGPRSSLLYVETLDRAGLLLEMIKIISDINVKVESAEIATVGLVAKDKFHVSYRGAALNSSMSQVLVNCLCYYLRRPQTDEDSY